MIHDHDIYNCSSTDMETPIYKSNALLSPRIASPSIRLSKFCEVKNKYLGISLNKFYTRLNSTLKCHLRGR